MATSGKYRYMSIMVDLMKEKLLKILQPPSKKAQNMMQKACLVYIWLHHRGILIHVKWNVQSCRCSMSSIVCSIGLCKCSHYPLELCLLLQIRMHLIAHMKDFLKHIYKCFSGYTEFE